MWWFVYGFFAEAGFGKDGEVIGCLGLTLWYREVRMLNMLGIGRRSMLSTRIRCVVVKGRDKDGAGGGGGLRDIVLIY